jgi:hypothetical protein
VRKSPLPGYAPAGQATLPREGLDRIYGQPQQLRDLLEGEHLLKRGAVALVELNSTDLESIREQLANQMLLVLTGRVGQPVQRSRLAAGKPDKQRDTILCHPQMIAKDIYR